MPTPETSAGHICAAEAGATPYTALPKVELHRHLEGSVRFSTLVEVARAHGLGPAEPGLLRTLVQIQSGEPATSQNFLAKFKTLRHFYRSPEIIGRIAREAVLDAAQDRVRYLELRFTPLALSQAQGFPLAEVLDWVIEGANQAQSEAAAITTALIVSLNRHESPRLAEQVVALALERRDRGIVGLDLAGDEAGFPAAPFTAIFQAARQAGLPTTVHAGEWGGAENVRQAILQLGAERIGHGVRVLEDPDAVALARERGTIFEVCLTSNVQSGVVPALANHPLPRLRAAGLNVTLCTDDPSISGISLSHEYRLACAHLGLTRPALHALIRTGAEAAFLPEPRRQSLLQALDEELAACP